MALTFQLPIPDLRLAANSSPFNRGQAFLKRKAGGKAKEIAAKEAMRVLKDARIAPPKWIKANYRAKWFNLKNQFPDPDNSNAALKAYIDGLAQAGIVKNDRNLWPERPEFIVCDKFPRIEITITPEL